MLEIIIIVLLTALNGVFAMSEIALVSSRRSRLEQKAKKGSRGAKTALELLENPEYFLSTVQVGITLIGIIAGAYGGVALSEDLIPYLEQISWLGDYVDEVAFTLVVAFITYLSLIIGELVPKTIAINNPEKITITLAPIMKVLSIITYPIVAFLSFSTQVMLKLFRIKERKEPPVTESELKYLIDQGSRHGVIEREESEIMKSVFSLGDRKASTIMTLRKDIEWLNANDSKEDNIAKIHGSAHSKFPLCDGSIDSILGTISTKKIFEQNATGKNYKLKDIIEKPLFFPENTPAFRVLDSFRKERIHIGYVVDEYGSTEGVITLHDLIENLVGEMPDIGEVVEPLVRIRDDGSWLIDGRIVIEDLKEAIEIDELPDEYTGGYATLGGLLVYEMRKIPKEGDKVQIEDYTFEIIDMDGNRIDKVMVKKEEKNEGEVA